MTAALGHSSCVYPGADVFIISFYSFLTPPPPQTNGMDFHMGLHEEMSHPLGPTAAAVQSLTVLFPIINILWFVSPPHPPSKDLLWQQRM